MELCVCVRLHACVRVCMRACVSIRAVVHSSKISHIVSAAELKQILQGSLFALGPSLPDTKPAAAKVSSDSKWGPFVMFSQRARLCLHWQSGGFVAAVFISPHSSPHLAAVRPPTNGGHFCKELWMRETPRRSQGPFFLTLGMLFAVRNCLVCIT